MLKVTRLARFSRVNDLIFGKDYFEAHKLLSRELNMKRGAASTLEDLLGHINLLKKLSLCDIHMRNYHNSDTTLFSIIQKVKDAKYLDKETQSVLRKSAYHTYMLYLTLNDPIKGESFGEEAYDTEHAKNIAGMLRFYMGNTLLLNEDFLDSKNTLSSIIDDSMDCTLSGMAYNNLGVACWWARHPNYSSLEEQYDRMVEEKETLPELDDDDDSGDDDFTASAHKIKVADFRHADNMFSSSIQQFEFAFYMATNARYTEAELALGVERNALEETNVEYLTSVPYLTAKRFAEETFQKEDAILWYLQQFEKGMLFQNPLSAFPLFNLAELKLSTGDTAIEKKKGTVYLHFAFQLLMQIYDRIKAFRRGELPVGWLKEDFVRLYTDYEKNYRSLLIRAVTFYSKINGLDAVDLSAGQAEGAGTRPGRHRPDRHLSQRRLLLHQLRTADPVAG